MPEMKICPDCSCDYLSHVETCVDCGTVLISLEENARRQDERKFCAEKTLENPVAVREGELRWLEELHGVLIGSGIPCRVHADPSCRKGCCGTGCQLLVSERDAGKANARIEAYFSEVHPEIRASQEMISQGKCPACGHTVGPAEVECPDCGLTLLIVE
jgi:hypothetical protein